MGRDKQTKEIIKRAVLGFPINLPVPFNKFNLFSYGDKNGWKICDEISGLVITGPNYFLTEDEAIDAAIAEINSVGVERLLELIANKINEKIDSNPNGESGNKAGVINENGT